MKWIKTEKDEKKQNKTKQQKFISNNRKHILINLNKTYKWT